MKKPEVFITGASGEVGQSLIHHIAEEGRYDIVAPRPSGTLSRTDQQM